MMPANARAFAVVLSTGRPTYVDHGLRLYTSRTLDANTQHRVRLDLLQTRTAGPIGL